MNNQQLQMAIDKCMNLITEKGSSIKQYHPFIYDRLSSNLAKLLEIQAVRASLCNKPIVSIKND